MTFTDRAVIRAAVAEGCYDMVEDFAISFLTLALVAADDDFVKQQLLD